jgi:hypothetical protein
MAGKARAQALSSSEQDHRARRMHDYYPVVIDLISESLGATPTLARSARYENFQAIVLKICMTF